MRSWTATLTRRGGWIAVDAIVVALSVLGGLYLSTHISGVPFGDKFTPLKFTVIFSAQLCMLIASSAIYLKAFRRRQTFRDDLRAIGSGVILASIVVAILFMVFQTHFKPLWIAVLDAAGPGLYTFVALSCIRMLERTLQHLNYQNTTVIFVQIDPQWRSSITEARQELDDDWRFVILSMDQESGDVSSADGIEHWNEEVLANWLEKAEAKGEKTLFVFGQHQPRTKLHASLIQKAYGNLIPITNMVDFYEEVLEKSPLFEDDEYWYSSTGLPKHNGFELWLKRVMDIVLAIPLLVVSVPAILVLTIIIRRESSGPGIFTQERVGLGGRVFTLYKLRSMTVHDDDSAQWPNFEASKVTKSGAFIRRTGLDELPQLFNVIKGDMSFVGPRPARPMVTQRHIDRLPYYAVVKSVKPGISGWAQLHQGQDAGDETMFEKTRYNLYYAKYFSIWLDILIYIRTFSQLINGKKRESVYMKIHLPDQNDGKEK